MNTIVPVPHSDVNRTEQLACENEWPMVNESAEFESAGDNNSSATLSAIKTCELADHLVSPTHAGAEDKKLAAGILVQLVAAGLLSCDGWADGHRELIGL